MEQAERHSDGQTGGKTEVCIACRMAAPSKCKGQGKTRESMEELKKSKESSRMQKNKKREDSGRKRKTSWD
jgi:hypothetical protein